MDAFHHICLCSAIAADTLLLEKTTNKWALYLCKAVSISSPLLWTSAQPFSIPACYPDLFILSSCLLSYIQTRTWNYTAILAVPSLSLSTFPRALSTQGKICFSISIKWIAVDRRVHTTHHLQEVFLMISNFEAMDIPRLLNMSSQKMLLSSCHLLHHPCVSHASGTLGICCFPVDPCLLLALWQSP